MDKLHHVLCKLDKSNSYKESYPFQDRFGNETDGNVNMLAQYIARTFRVALIKLNEEYYLAGYGEMTKNKTKNSLGQLVPMTGFIQLDGGDLKEGDRIWVKFLRPTDFNKHWRIEYGHSVPPRDRIRRIFFDAGLRFNKEIFSYGCTDVVFNWARKVFNDDIRENGVYDQLNLVVPIFSKSGHSYARVVYQFSSKSNSVITKIFHVYFIDTVPAKAEARDLVEQIQRYCNIYGFD